MNKSNHAATLDCIVTFTQMQYLVTVASENGDCSTEAAVAPSVSKTPQKSQITKILDKVKKEQQLKGKHIFID